MKEKPTIQILVPISGYSPFFPEEEYFFPKPLVNVAGRPMIERTINPLREQFPGAKFFFTVLKSQSRKFSIGRTLEILGGPHTTIIEKQSETQGALCSSLLAVDCLDPNAPLIIVNCDQIIDVDLQSCVDYFELEEAGAGVISFNSVHPRWCYVVKNQNGDVSHAIEKKVESDTAIAGFYYFRTAATFVDAASRALIYGDHVDGSYYISAALNQVILDGKRVVSTHINEEDYHAFFSPERIDAFKETELARRLITARASKPPINIIIPAAGEGSRFKNNGWRKPKPFIDIDGKPMVSHVGKNIQLPNSNLHLLLRSDHIAAHSEVVDQLRADDFQVQNVENLTEGTVCTVLLARSKFDNDCPLLIANSDQLVDFDCSAFVSDALNRNLDGSILVFRDHEKDPKWSFAKVSKEGLVTEVAEKKPISDLATVGIYYFKHGNDFVRAAVDMIARNVRVNGEFYTCPVYNFMIAQGLRIGVYEINSNAMKPLGTPDDLLDYFRNTGIHISSDAPPR